MYTCRECEHVINQATELCPYCGTDLTAPTGGELEEPVGKKSLASILFRWVMLLVALTGMLWAFLWYVLPEKKSDSAQQAETQAVQALRELREALADYAAAQGGSFPASLEQLGETPRGSAQKALSRGYLLHYTPGPAGRDGVIHTYSVLARAGNYGYRNFYTDETGVFRATRENRAATAQDPPM